MDLSKVFQTVVFLIGGVGIFLLGLRFLSMGLQTIAGPTLKKLIGKVTNHRLLGLAVGTAVTCLVQSSAVTMAMVIGFVNAGIMTLSQTLGVIMGANVGTTITGWVLVLHIDQYGLPLAGVFALVYCFSKRERIRYSALALLGVGLVFVGLYTMKTAIAPVSQDPAFLSALSFFGASDFLSICACIVVGFLLATVMQSSSASLGVTIVLASQGMIGFETAAALVIGQNIGCTVPALMIAANTSRHARRAAFFHLCFNLFGALVFTLFFFQLMSLMHWIFGNAFGIKDLKSDKNITLAIALFHTFFNLTTAIILLPLLGKIPVWLDKLFPNKATSKKAIVTKLDPALIKSPFVAITQSAREMEMMCESVIEMLRNLRACLLGEGETKTLADSVFDEEKRLDTAQTEVIDFLTSLLGVTNVSQSVASDAERQLRMSDDLETASDYVAQILKLHLRLNDQEVRFDESHAEGILELHDMVANLAEQILLFLRDNRNAQRLSDIRKEGHSITQLVRELRSTHWRHVAEGPSDPLLTTTFTDMLNAYRKLKEHLAVAAQTVVA